jgi:hypothetical protein
MIDVEQEDAAHAVRGVLDLELADEGFVPVRVPPRYGHQLPDSFTREIFRTAGGARLVFRTEAVALELELAAFRIEVIGSSLPVVPVVVDLVVNGSRYAAEILDETGTRTFDPDGNLVGETRRLSVVRLVGLPSGEKTIEVWLPESAVVEVCGLRADAPMLPYEDSRPRWIHYGSSISHSFGARRPTETWPAVAALLADVDLLNLGVAGQCFLDQFVARAIRDEPASFISLKLGINVVNADALKLRTFVPVAHGFIDTVREGHPGTPILVVSPIYCPVHEDTPGPTLARDPEGPFVAAAETVDAVTAKRALTLRRIRALLEEVVRTRSDPNLHYLDGLALFSEADAADLPDLLHPNGDGYVRIGERFANAVFGAGGAFER